MALSWNEIKTRATAFSKEWADTDNEDAEAKPFLEAFFYVFGVSRKKVGSFEHRVKKLDDHDGYIDLLWKGNILIEMKSKGKSLDKAFKQAKDYLHGLKDHELPRYILTSDFENFKLTDLEEDKTVEFKLKDFVKNVQHFGFIAGYQQHTYKEQDPVNIKAADLMGKLHDSLEEIGYHGHELEVYLVRILFCLFAEDTTIFNKQQFQDFVEQRTNEDGSDLASKLHELFQVLNTPKEKRFKNLDEQLAEFPYVNGKLFEENLRMASFDSKMRQALINCCYLDWSKISPAIFGSMFQSVMNPQERRNLGAHYTSEKNILKLIKPLFLDELWQEFESVKDNKNKLPEFHKKLSTLKFLDPACGCGNFLVITYRELRFLEIEILRAMNKTGQGFLDVRDIIWLDVDMMYGIEYEEFPARIAEVAMWLIDHQMNMLISQEFGQYFVRLPLKKAATIVHGNALTIDWQSLLNPVNTIDIEAEHANVYIVEEQPAKYGTVNVQAKSVKVHTGTKPAPASEVKFDYILGNPPFIGSKLMKQEQRNQIVELFNNTQGSGVLDYVTGWYIKAAKYIQGTQIKVAFVSTNSIVQGEQTSVLWGQMLNKYNIKIHFAHRTFKWGNEAKGNAAVYCVIVGFANYDVPDKKIYEYEDIKGEAHELKAKNVNAYLIDGKDVLLRKSTEQICKAPRIKFGNQPIDGGGLILTEIEKETVIKKEPSVSKFIRKYVGSDEFINNIPRYCLWLVDALPSELRSSEFISERLKKVKAFREASSRQATKDLANTPSQFAFVSHNDREYIIIPSVSSERRKYVPIGFMGSDVIASNLCLIIPNATFYHFGVLTSLMHNVWIRYTCGRLEGRYRYSNTIVYNNFPWPENFTEKQKSAIELAAQKVLDVRAKYPDSSLADLYDPLTMPADLVKAHNELDKAVDLAYRPQPFVSEAKRMEFLFELYEKYTADLFTKEKTKKGKKKEKA